MDVKLRFRSQKEKHELSDLYEAKIKNMGNAGRKRRRVDRRSALNPGIRRSPLLGGLYTLLRHSNRPLNSHLELAVLPIVVRQHLGNQERKLLGNVDPHEGLFGIICWYWRLV